MADKTIIDFPTISDSRDEDLAYLLRGLNLDRDKSSPVYVLKEKERRALQEIYGVTGIVSQTTFTITGNADAEFTLDINILVILEYAFSLGTYPMLGDVAAFTNKSLSSGVPNTSGTNYLWLEYGGSGTWELHTSTSEPTGDNQVLLATYTVTGSSGSFVFTITGKVDSFETLFTEANNGTETSPDSLPGKLGKELRSFDFSVATINTGQGATKINKLVDSVSKVGAAFNVGSYPAIAALSPTRIAIIDAAFTTLRTFQFDGSDWTQIGNSLSIIADVDSRLVPLSDTTVAYTDGSGSLKTYEFDGADWGVISNTYNVSGSTGVSSLVSMGNNRVARIDDQNLLIMFELDGFAWSQVGNSFSVSGGAIRDMTAISNDLMIMVGDDKSRLFKFYEGTGNWYLVQESSPIFMGRPYIAAMSASVFVMYDSIVQAFRIYKNIDMNLIGYEEDLDIIDADLAAVSTNRFVAAARGGSVQMYELIYADNPPPVPALN